MAQFGLEDTVHPLGDHQHLEIWGQLEGDKDGEAGRRVGGRRGFGGYMAIVEVRGIETCSQLPLHPRPPQKPGHAGVLRLTERRCGSPGQGRTIRRAST